MNGAQRHRLGTIARMAKSGDMTGVAVHDAIRAVLDHDYARLSAVRKNAEAGGPKLGDVDDRDDDDILAEHKSLGDIWPSAKYLPKDQG